MPILSFKHQLAACLFGFCAAASAVTVTDSADRQPNNIFYNSGAEGWYWYQDPVPEELLLEEMPPPMPPEAPEPSKPEETVAKGPEPFSLKWVQTMLPKYQEKAWNDPSPENVQAYFLIQRFAMDRANKFADVAQQVVVGNALLDESMRRPLASFANTYLDRDAARKTDALLKRVAEKAGVFFFFKSDCRYCEAQAPILAYLEEYGFHVLAVSLDGGELQSHKFKDTRRDSGQSAKLGVQATPAIYLMDEEGRFSALGQSVIAYGELRRRILLVAARSGWITEAEFKETEPILNPNEQHDLSVELPKLLKASTENPAMLFGSEEQTQKILAMSSEQKNSLLDEDNFIEPSKLIALFGTKGQTVGQISEGEEDENER